MAYQLQDLNFRTVSDPKALVEEGEAAYKAKVEKAAEMIIQNRKKALSCFYPAPPAQARPLRQ